MSRGERSGRPQAALTRSAWEETILAPARARTPDRSAAFLTTSGYPIDVVYTPDDVESGHSHADAGEPGPGASGVGGGTGLWVWQIDAGVGTPEDCHERIRQLQAAGATGFSLRFDRPTALGLDPDHAAAHGDVGRDGVSAAVLADIARIWGQVQPAAARMSIDAGAASDVLLGLMVAGFDADGIEVSLVAGSVEADILGMVAAGYPQIYPLRHALRLRIDALQYAAQRLPRWTLASNGWYVRMAGATPRQELALTLASAAEYVQAGLDSGLDIESIVPRISCTFGIGVDVFEEMAKLRAARRVWAQVMQQRFGVRRPDAFPMPLHARVLDARTSSSVTSASSGAGEDAAVRTVFQAMAAVLGGAHSLECGGQRARNDLDAAILALRTQQILAHEGRLDPAADPFGGSWWLERLTRDMTEQALADIQAIDGLGGMETAVYQGAVQQQIAQGLSPPAAGADAAAVVASRDDAATQRRIARHRDVQLERLHDNRRNRKDDTVRRALGQLEEVASGPGNVMEAVMAAARARASLGEMCEALRRVWAPDAGRDDA